MTRTIIRLLTAFSIFLLLFPIAASLQGQTDEQSLIKVFEIDGAIGPATSDYLVRGIEQAQLDGNSMVVITMDTPGGLDLAMRDIIQAILESDIPVVSYVYPQGSRAASAGTYILYASPVAAMAPATNLGAATPVQIGLPSVPDTIRDENQDETDNSDTSAGGTAMERKMINDATAYIRGLADLHGRNADWAVSAVEDAATLSASEALENNVIDLVAEDLDDLMEQLDGRTVVVNGQSITLQLDDKNLVMDEPDWRTEFLRVITNPNLILLLGMLGAYGLIIEFYNPGFGFAGITGAICLLLAAYGLQLLPINYVGLGLVIFGLILIVSEAFIPSFGILGIGGLISFIFGAVILVDTDMSVFRVSLPLIAAFVVATGLLLIITIRIFMRVSKQAAVSGIEQFVGLSGECISNFDESGMVKVDGEIWKAVTDTPLHSGDHVIVKKVNGLELEVTKA